MLDWAHAAALDFDSCYGPLASCTRAGYTPVSCLDTDCSGHGQCALIEEWEPRCDCDVGYKNDAPLSCISDSIPPASPSIELSDALNFSTTITYSASVAIRIFVDFDAVKCCLLQQPV